MMDVSPPPEIKQIKRELVGLQAAQSVEPTAERAQQIAMRLSDLDEAERKHKRQRYG